MEKLTSDVWRLDQRAPAAQGGPDVIPNDLFRVRHDSSRCDDGRPRWHRHAPSSSAASSNAAASCRTAGPPELRVVDPAGNAAAALAASFLAARTPAVHALAGTGLKIRDLGSALSDPWRHRWRRTIPWSGAAVLRVVGEASETLAEFGVVHDEIDEAAVLRSGDVQLAQGAWFTHPDRAFDHSPC